MLQSVQIPPSQRYTSQNYISSAKADTIIAQTSASVFHCDCVSLSSFTYEVLVMIFESLCNHRWHEVHKAISKCRSLSFWCQYIIDPLLWNRDSGTLDRIGQEADLCDVRGLVISDYPKGNPPYIQAIYECIPHIPLTTRNNSAVVKGALHT